MSELDYFSGLYQTRDQYRSNAEKAIVAGEYRKASELLWGAVTQQLKALAATRSIVITRHGEFFDFVRQLGAELNDRELYTDFVELNALHRNFYDETIPPDVFPDFYHKAIPYIDRLDALARGRMT